MSRDQRADDNWALLYAQQKALSAHNPLLVAFCLVPEFMHAGMRAYAFMLDGLKQVSMRLKEKAIPFALLVGSPQKTLPDFLKRISASLLVADFDPLKTKIRWQESTARRIDIPFDQVDAHNIVPCWTASPKLEWAAYTFRPKMRRLLPAFLDAFPKLKKHPFTRPNGWGKIDWPDAEASVKPRKPSGRLGATLSGERPARLTLDRFMRDKLLRYLEDRNNPAVDGLSGLSPYIHFGQISAQRIALELLSRAEPDANADAFLEQLIVRRELSDNYCFYNGTYDSFDGFPEWAKATLTAHTLDRRPALYSLRALEAAETHDALWNAAQVEMAETGKMHGILRMYWAKKILEWTRRPEEAFETALVLNDKYELDGRDPNGIVGCAWSIGGVHDRAWGERPIFGKIRTMTLAGQSSKFDIQAAIRKIRLG